MHHFVNVLLYFVISYGAQLSYISAKYLKEFKFTYWKTNPVANVPTWRVLITFVAWSEWPSCDVAVIFCIFVTMPILDKIKSIFQVSAPYSETRRKYKGLQYLKRDVDPESVWEVVGELGDGSFGKVYKVQA